MSYLKGSKHPSAKLSEEDVRRVIDARKERMELQKRMRDLSAKRLSQQLGCSPSTINKIWEGVAWTHVE